MPGVQKLRFVTRNDLKIGEAKTILERFNITVMPMHHEIEELQTPDIERLVRDKALKAFQRMGEPLFVEHTGLYLDYLQGLPGGLTKIFWDTLRAEKFSELFGQSDRNRVTARTVIGYIDGKRFRYFEGCITGTVASAPRGEKGFHWDSIFVPDGSDQTFAEMGEARKNEISMRRKALELFAKELAGARR